MAEDFSFPSLNFAPKATEYYLIENESDFPIQDGTTITLQSGYYDLNATIVTSKRFIVDTDVYIRFVGRSFSNAGIVYTGTDSMFTGDDFLSLDFDNIFVSSPASGSMLLDFQPSVKNTAGIFFIESAAVDCNDLGIVKNIGTFSCIFSAFQDIGDGMIIDTVDAFSISISQLNTWKNRANAIFMTLQGTINDFVLTGTTFSLGTNETLFDIKSTSTINSGSIVGCPVNLSVGSTVFAVGSKDQSSTNLHFGVNTNIPESTVFANSKINVPQTVAISIANTPVRVDDTNTGGTNIWTLIDSERFSIDTTTGRLTYTGREDTSITIITTSTVEKVGGGSDEIGTLLYKNGSEITESKSTTRNTTPTTVTSIANTSLSTNDYIELYTVNVTGTADIIFDRNNLIIE